MPSSSTTNTTRSFILVFAEDEYHWVSLKEANRKVIQYWKHYESEDLKLEVVNLSLDHPNLKKFLTSEFVIISKLTSITARFVKQLRDFHPESKIIFHGLESASIYFANTFLYGLEPYLKKRDIWVMSCEADRELAYKSWKNIRTEVIPFDVPVDHAPAQEGEDLLFFGRISTQKNLHEAFYALALIQEKLRSEKRRFKIYGYEDHLGVPHLAISGKRYLSYLNKLARKLNIQDLVEFHSFISEEKMNEVLQTGILLSPSVHSDENFGLVAYRALAMGQRAILTYWGGHKDYEKIFKNVSFIKVYETKNGNHLSPRELAETILKVLNGKNLPVEKHEIKKLNLDMSGDEGLEPTDIKKDFNKRLHGFKRWPYYGKLFKSYQDLLFLQASKVYGAIPLRKMNVNDALVLPHVKVTREHITLSDSRSEFLKMSRSAGEDILLKQLGSRKKVKLSHLECQWLWDNGGLC